MLPSQPNQSLIDGLACLQVLTAAGEPLGTRELGRLLGLQPVRVNRLLKTLAHLGLAEQDERRKYRPGPGIHALAAHSLRGSGLISRALPVLEELGDLGLIVALGVLWRDEVCYLYHAGPDATMAHALSHPVVFPAASSGLGLALLAELSEQQVRDTYAEPSVVSAVSDAYAPVELDGDDGLIAQLARIRRQGFALTQIPGMGHRTLAVSIGRPGYAAVGLSGTFADAQVHELLGRLHDAVQRIDAAGRPGDPSGEPATSTTP